MFKRRLQYTLADSLAALAGCASTGNSGNAEVVMEEFRVQSEPGIQVSGTATLRNARRRSGKC